MRMTAMSFSFLRSPRCRIDILSSLWCENFQSLDGTCKKSSSSMLCVSNNHGVEGGYSRRWIRRSITTKTERNRSTKPGILDETVLTSPELDIQKSQISYVQRLPYCDNQQKISENKDLARLVTVIVFDIETTGFSRDNDRIIEIALRDLAGGANSTFQTLVNPGRSVPNAHIHGIKTHMVNRSDVPRMGDLLPILLQFIKSRQKPGGHVLLVAHNARSFDVPFLRNEFSRCSVEFPQDWKFLDTLPLSREWLKSEGLKVTSGTSLQALREYYKIQLHGSAHRALSDVNVLSCVLQRLTFDLKLTVGGLLERSFAASDLGSPKKS